MKFIAFLFTLSLSTVLLAQDGIVIIDRSQARLKRNKEIRRTENIQVYKFAPLSVLDGEVLFGYERQLTSKGSFEVELGPTLSKIGFGTTGHIGNSLEPEVDEVSGLGVVLGVAYRYYPLDETEALNRFYISPQFRFKRYNHTVQDFAGFLPEAARGNETMANFFFNFGYQSWLSNTFSLDFYFGLGIGQYTSRDYDSEIFFNGNDWEYRWQEVNSSGARYVVNAGIKVGIGSE